MPLIFSIFSGTFLWRRTVLQGKDGFRLWVCDNAGGLME